MIVIYALVIILIAVYTASYAMYEAKSKQHYLSCAATVGVCVLEIALPVVMLILR